GARPAAPAAVEIEKMGTVRRQEHVVCVQVGMPDAGIMKAPDAGAYRTPAGSGKRLARQALRERFGRRDALGHDIGAVAEPGSANPNRYRARHRQALPVELREQRPLAHRPRAYEPEPEVAVDEPRTENAAAAVVA